MAKKIKAFVKLALPAGKATPAPPVGPALGQHGVNIAAFCKEYNAKTSEKMGLSLDNIKSNISECENPPTPSKLLLSAITSTSLSILVSRFLSAAVMFCLTITTKREYSLKLKLNIFSPLSDSTSKTISSEHLVCIL